MGEMAEYYMEREAAMDLDQVDLPVPSRRKFVAIDINDKNVTENKFYVGSPLTLKNNWGHSEVRGALKHAADLVNKQGQDQFIVQIVAVVRRQQTPIVIEPVDPEFTLTPPEPAFLRNVPARKRATKKRAATRRAK